jgi:hypothetical protein
MSRWSTSRARKNTDFSLPLPLRAIVTGKKFKSKEVNMALQLGALRDALLEAGATPGRLGGRGGSQL